MLPDVPEGFRAGFACFVGRPNAGKSTLMNALVGTKIAITSDKPQTTRHAIRGIVHRDNSQLIIVDTPGVHRPRTLLGSRLNDVVRDTWSEVDIVGVCIPAGEKIGPGDRFILEAVSKLSGPKIIAIVTKADTVKRNVVAEQLLAVSALGEELVGGFAEVVPVSAVSGEGIERLVEVIASYLPESPPLYPEDEITDEPERTLIAEFIREAALAHAREELPHSLAVVVDEYSQRPGKGDNPGILDVFADIYVERSSQKPIIIGPGGVRIREIGATARRDIEQLFETKVNLQLHVKVAKEWQRDPKLLNKLGF